MCETYADRVENLDYKTIRYPGHAMLMNFFFHELLMRENRLEAGRILTHAKPPVDEDVVFIHVAAEGWRDGQLNRKEFVRAYYPMNIGGIRRAAIAWTTSSSAVATIEMVRNGKLPQRGVLKQEMIQWISFYQHVLAAILLLTTRAGTNSAFDLRTPEHHLGVLIAA